MLTLIGCTIPLPCLTLSLILSTVLAMITFPTVFDTISRVWRIGKPDLVRVPNTLENLDMAVFKKIGPNTGSFSFRLSNWTLPFSVLIYRLMRKTRVIIETNPTCQ